jgi:hypothetical protein
MNPRLLRPVASGFNPKSIAGLALWLDASDSATLFDADTGGATPAANGQVGRWEDKSGLGRHATQSFGNNRPLRLVSTQNGRDGLEFDASNDSLVTAAFEHTVAFTVFVAHKYTSSTVANNSRIIEHGANNGLRVVTNGTVYRVEYVNAGLNSSAAISTLPTLLTCFGNDAATRSIELLVNEVSALTITSAGTPTTPVAFNVNRFGGGGFHSPQVVFEIVYYNNLLTTLQRNAVQRYLKTKWSLY